MSLNFVPGSFLFRSFAVYVYVAIQQYNEYHQVSRFGGYVSVKVSKRGTYDNGRNGARRYVCYCSSGQTGRRERSAAS